jgi:O-antigen/teichoic acid export membrane protein
MNRDALASHISSHTILNILADAFRILVSTFMIIYVARKLGPSEYGIVSLGLSITAIAGLFYDFGISTSTARFLAETSDDKVYLSGAQLNILFSFAGLILTFVLAKPIASFVRIGSPIYIQIIGGITFFSSLFRFSSRSLQGAKKTDKVALINFIHTVAVSVIVVIMVYLGYRAQGVLIGYSLSWTIAWIVALVILAKSFRIFSMAFNSVILKQIFIYALPLLLTSSSYFLLLRGPAVLLSVFSSTKEVSFLHIPMRIIELLALPAYSASLVTCPFFTKRREGDSDQKWLYVKIFKYFLVLYLPLSAFLALSAHRLISVVFGAEYLNAAVPLIILALYTPFFVITNFTGTTLDFLGLAKQKSIVFAGTTLIAILAAIIVIPHHKEIGAALVIAVPYTAFSIYTIITSSRKIKIYLRRYSADFVKLLLITCIASIPTFLFLRVFQGITSLVIAFLISIITFYSLGEISSAFKMKELFSFFKLIRQRS